MENKQIGKTFVVADIHGNYKGFIQAIQRSGIDYENDTLISLGDLVDGHFDSYEVIEELLKFKNLILIKGNHDEWFKEWLNTGINPVQWGAGQLATAISYMKHWGISNGFERVGDGFKVQLTVDQIPEQHVELLNSQLDYYKDKDNNLFLHGGFNRHFLLEDQPSYTFYWDRDLWAQALSFKSMSKPKEMDEDIKFKIVEPVKEIFIGHTSTEFWNTDKPMNAAQLWNLDTGGGWFGRITIMNIETKEFWQSERASELYPEFKGRNQY